MLVTGFNEGVQASETSKEFIFNCSKQGEVVVPNTGAPFSRFDPNNSDLDRVEYTPSFSKTGILLRSDREDFFIDLKSGDLLFRTEVIEKCDILQRPTDYELSSNEFMFFCDQQGGLVIPNTGVSFVSDWDGVEYTPSFSKTGIFLKSDVGDYVINLQSSDLYWRWLERWWSFRQMQNPGRPEQDGGLNLQPAQNAESKVTGTGKLPKPLVGSVDTKDQILASKI